MGRKRSWLSAVKKALSPEYREKKNKKSGKSKKYWFAKQKSLDANFAPEEIAVTIPAPPSPPPLSTPHEQAENEQIAVEKVAVAVAEDAAEVVHLTNVDSPRSCKLTEETAAFKIQAAFRGHLARRAFRTLRGLVRLKSLMQASSVKRQANTTLKCMQTLARVQSQIRAQRIRMSEENQALQRQLVHKREKELEKLRASMGEEWVGSTQSQEQMEASLQNKQEAAMRRERALAYAYSHQQIRRSTSKPSNPTYMDPINPHWGWSWLERWMAARPWENRSTVDRELNSDHASVRSATSHAISVGEISKAHSFRYNKPSPKHSRPARPQSFASPSYKSPTSASGKLKPVNPKERINGLEDDSRSTMSIQSEQQSRRRHTMGGSSFKDDESLASSPAVPSYMAATHTAKAKSSTAKTKLPSPLGIDKNGTPRVKGSMNSPKIKKRLSFPAAGSRRHSGPPRVEPSHAKDISVSS